MPLNSELFTQPARDPKLEGCLVDDAKHIVPGANGGHVRKIQTALNLLSEGAGPNLDIDGIYGPLTAAAVKKFKDAPQRRILQPWQTSADNIVGKRTIKALDDEMDVLENESPASSDLVASDHFGQPHDHTKCPPPSVDEEIEKNPADKTMSHIGTPMNPLGFGRRVNIGGKFETKYLGFQDFVPDPSFVNGRPFTNRIQDHTVSDICFRSTPIDKFMREKEIPRICRLGARLTFVSNSGTVQGLLPFFATIGLSFKQA
jgi:peptidoglycan hydrolase-like protein with peptidoglycan-binding domain